ncbi:MAG: cation:proton antiporter [Bacteroidales bacterium]|jgi:NhaP-type Na+/H+ or K+/H+ antiporter|nr:cation:proton antiporter [Bacteroidales bacterium]
MGTGLLLSATLDKGHWIYFIFLGILIFCAHLFSAFFSRKRVPDVLFLVLIGIVLGPVLGWLTPDMLGGMGALFASVTLVFILVDSGIDMHLDDLRRYWVGVVQVMFYSFLLSMTIAAVTAHFIADTEWMSSFLLGSMVAGTGASIVIPMVRQMKVSDKTRTVLTLESAISAVLCIVVALAIMEGMKMGQIRFEKIMGNVLASFFMAVILGVLGGMIWSGVLQRVRRLQNSMFLTPAFVFVIYGITEALGYSGAIAALAFGIVLGNASYFEFSFMRKILRKRRPQMQSLEEKEKSFFKEIVFILKTFFFVYIGISIPFTDTMALLYGVVIAAAIFVGRFILVAIVGRKNTKTDRQIVSIMIPKGLASAVLASMPRQVNLAAGYEVVPNAERIECMVYSIIFFSIVICSLLVLLSRKRIIDEEFKPDQMEEVYDYE